MELKYSITRTDYKEFSQAMHKRLGQKNKKDKRIFYGLIILISATYGLITGFLDLGSSNLQMGFILLLIFHYALALQWLKTRVYKNLGDWTLGERTMTLEEEGIRTESDLCSDLARWNAVQDVIVTKNLIVIVLGALAGHIIPLTAFHDDSEKEQWLAELESYRARSSTKAQ